MSEKLKSKKSLGQHFLTSDTIPKVMCDAAELSAKETVLEIGPGTGVLTKEMLKRGCTVIALEADERAVEVLNEMFEAEIAESLLTVIHCDVRTIDVTKIPGLKAKKYKIVANIPYYLSGMLFRTFLESTVQPSTLVYLVQKEVAKRVCASISKGEKESLLSLSVQLYGDPEYVKTVSRNHFRPKPKVDSAVVAVRNVSKDRTRDIDERLFFDVLHMGFGQKRKQLLGNLSKQYSRESLTNIFSTLKLSVSTRAEDVSLDIWLALVKKLESTAN